MTEFHFTKDEIGCTMVFKAIHDGQIASVLWAEKRTDEDSNESCFFYGFFEDYCNAETISDKKAFHDFILTNDDNGFSTGAFDSISELNADADFQDFIPVFGTFEDF